MLWSKYVVIVTRPRIAGGQRVSAFFLGLGAALITKTTATYYAFCDVFLASLSDFVLIVFVSFNFNILDLYTIDLVELV